MYGWGRSQEVVYGHGQAQLAARPDSGSPSLTLARVRFAYRAFPPLEERRITPVLSEPLCGLPFRGPLGRNQRKGLGVGPQMPASGRFTGAERRPTVRKST